MVLNGGLHEGGFPHFINFVRLMKLQRDVANQSNFTSNELFVQSDCLMIAFCVQIGSTKPHSGRLWPTAYATRRQTLGNYQAIMLQKDIRRPSEQIKKNCAVQGAEQLLVYSVVAL